LKFILGINAYHGDSSAALVVDGRLIAAVEEERFRRIKHWAGFPSEAIRFCLEEANISLEQVDAVAVNQDSKANLWKKLGFMLTKRPDLKFVLDKIRNRRKRIGIVEQLNHLFHSQEFNGKVYPVEHHLISVAMPKQSYLAYCLPTHHICNLPTCSRVSLCLR